MLSGILYNRLTVYTEGLLGENQFGFRANCSTIDHIFTIRQKNKSLVVQYTLK